MSHEFINEEQLFKKLWHEGIRDFVESAKRKNQSTNEFIPAMTRNIRKSLRDGSLIEKINFCNDAKDNGRAAQLRTAGNKMFHPNVKRYIEALKLYNECITFSEKGSVERARAYGIRSVICLKMQRYEECLENIRLARESNYPETWKEKLDERENSAKQALAKMADKKAASSKDSSEAVQEVQLSYPSHENAPQIANCLELHKNDQYGRHVVTNRKLKVGDVVMIDKPFVTVLDEMLRCVRCDFCQAERLFTLIPCEGCSWVMYCSEECKSQAYNKYHRYECGVIRPLWKMQKEIFVIALRTIATAIAIFDNDLEALEDHISSLDQTKVNGFTMDWRQATQTDIFNTMHVLTTNQEDKFREHLVLNIFHAIIIQKLILERTELGKICEETPNRGNLLENLILHYTQSVTCNVRPMGFMQLDVMYRLYKNDKYATGCYPLLSMLNHSCAPNVVRITLRDGRCAVIVIRPIAAGGQLFNDYDGMHHLSHDRRERHVHLLRNFNFPCLCEACRGNYPTYDDMSQRPLLSPKSHEVEKLFNDTMKFHDSKKALRVIAELREHLNSKAIRYPSFDACSGQIHLETCYFIVYQYTSEAENYWKYCKP